MKHLVTERENIQPEIYNGSRALAGHKNQQHFRNVLPTQTKGSSPTFRPAVQHHRGRMQVCWYVTWSTLSPCVWGNAAGNLLGCRICPWPWLPLQTNQAFCCKSRCSRGGPASATQELLNTSKYLLTEANSIAAKSLTMFAPRNRFGRESCKSGTPGQELQLLPPPT